MDTGVRVETHTDTLTTVGSRHFNQWRRRCHIGVNLFSLLLQANQRTFQAFLWNGKKTFSNSFHEMACSRLFFFFLFRILIVFLSFSSCFFSTRLAHTHTSRSDTDVPWMEVSLITSFHSWARFDPKRSLFFFDLFAHNHFVILFFTYYISWRICNHFCLSTSFARMNHCCVDVLLQGRDSDSRIGVQPLEKCAMIRHRWRKFREIFRLFLLFFVESRNSQEGHEKCNTFSRHAAAVAVVQMSSSWFFFWVLTWKYRTYILGKGERDSTTTTSRPAAKPMHGSACVIYDLRKVTVVSSRVQSRVLITGHHHHHHCFCYDCPNGVNHFLFLVVGFI